MSGGTVADPSPPPARTSRRLRRARRRRLVGGAGELELLRAALEAPVPPFAVLILHAGREPALCLPLAA